MRQALERRFRKAAEALSGPDPGASGNDASSSRAALPDLLLIDGGAGQVAQANAVLADFGMVDVHVVGVSKGEARRPGDETLLLPDGRELHPGAGSLGLQLIQQVRDEAHRFAQHYHHILRRKRVFEEDVAAGRRPPRGRRPPSAQQ